MPVIVGSGITIGTGISIVMDTPALVTNGLSIYYDAGVAASYPGSGTTWTDLSGSAINGTLSAGTSYSATNGGSIVFDGVSGKVTFPNSTVTTTSGVTVDIWFKTSSTTKYQDIFDTADSTGIWMATNFSPATQTIMAGFNTLTGYMTYSNYQANTWYQVTLAGSGTSNILYINGVQQATASQTVATSVPLNTARIGQVDGDRAAEYLVGNVSAFMLYNRQLTASEVTQNFNAFRKRYGL